MAGENEATAEQAAGSMHGMPEAHQPIARDNRAPLIERLLRQCLVWPLWRLASSGDYQSVVLRDTDRWITSLKWDFLSQESQFARFAWLFSALPEFRSLTYFRLSGKSRLALILARRAWKPLANFAIHCPSVGGGLFIQHGFATVITAASIGEDCWINQQVTIGWTEKGQPTLGKGVTVGAGAVVVGPVTVGDGATIGANATVVEDVEPGSVVVGAKASPASHSRQV